MRKLTILEHLQKQQDYTPITFFVDYFKVSTRTIQKDISELIHTGKSNGYYLYLKRGKGYVLEVEESTLFFAYLQEMRNSSINYSAILEDIIALIALQPSYITLQSIADSLFISRSSLKKYLQQGSDLIETYQLSLESKAHYGVRIAQPLIKRRELLLYLYSHNSLSKDTIDASIGTDGSEIKERVIEYIKEQQRVINYPQLEMLLNWLKITIYIYIRQLIKEEILVENQIFQFISQQYDTYYNADIPVFLELCKAYTKPKKRINDERIRHIVTEYLGMLDKKKGMHFLEDVDCINRLSVHISSLLENSLFSISYHNPVADELVIKYPMLFNMVIGLSAILEKEFSIQINKDEMGLMTTYFLLHMEKETRYHLSRYSNIAVICSSGGGSAHLIKLKMQTLFKEATIQTFSLLQMAEVHDFKPDLIFSIMPLSESFNVPCIYIKELLDDYDILRIKQLLPVDNQIQISMQDNFMNHFFDPSFFSIVDTLDDYWTCLSNMSQSLEQANIGGTGYSQMVLQREQYASTIYLNGVVIAHPIEMCANKDCIAVKIIKKPFIQDQKPVRIIFMVALTKQNIAMHTEITSRLFAIMHHYTLVENITKVHTFQEFLAILNEKQ